MKRVMPGVFSIVLIAATAAGLMNTYADAGPIEAKARIAACAGQGPKCNAQPMQTLRTPLWHDMKLRTSKKVAEVRCARAYYLVGDFACAIR